MFTDPQKNLKSLAQFLNKLMLVKHVSRIENMVVNLFWYLTKILQHSEYKKQYFSEEVNFSDSFEAASKINEMTTFASSLHLYYYLT